MARVIATHTHAPPLARRAHRELHTYTPRVAVPSSRPCPSRGAPVTGQAPPSTKRASQPPTSSSSPRYHTHIHNSYYSHKRRAFPPHLSVTIPEQIGGRSQSDTHINFMQHRRPGLFLLSYAFVCNYRCIYFLYWIRRPLVPPDIDVRHRYRGAYRFGSVSRMKRVIVIRAKG